MASFAVSLAALISISIVLRSGSFRRPSPSSSSLKIWSPYSATPAFRNTWSRPPNFWTQASNAARCEVQEVISHFWNENREDDVKEVGAVGTGGFRSTTTTLLPSSCRMIAVCKPIPEDPPVMRAVSRVGDFSCSRVIVNALLAMVATLSNKRCGEGGAEKIASADIGPSPHGLPGRPQPRNFDSKPSGFG